MTEGYDNIEFDIIFCSQKEFDRLYGELIEDFDESEEFDDEDFDNEWRRIHEELDEELKRYWVEDCFGMEDFSLLEDHNYTYHKAGGVYSERVICREFVQIIIGILSNNTHARNWVFHFTCENEAIPGEFFIKGNTVFCTGEPRLSRHLKKGKIKPESLHRCVELDNLKWVKQMYKPGLFYWPASRDEKGNFPQHYVKSPVVADFLNERGFDLNLRNEEGHTVLDKIVNKEPWLYRKSDFNNPLCKHLMRTGAKTSFEIDHPLHFQCLLGSVKDIKEELKFNNLYELDSYLNEPPLMYALRSGIISKVKLILSQGADIDQKAADGDCVLVAAYNCNAGIKIVKMLLEHGADVNARSPLQNDASILHLFCQRSLEMVKLMIDSGANITDRDAEGRTAAFYADGMDAIEILKYLHSKGLNLAVKDHEGKTCVDHFTQWAESFSHDSKLSSKYMNFALKAQTLIDEDIRIGMN